MTHSFTFIKQYRFLILVMLKKLPLVTLFSILFPGTSFALGFGEITVFSKLNEPLKVHIELVDSKSTPIDEITVKNAPRNIYRRANLPRPEAFNRVKFKTTKLANGNVIVVVTSKKPVREPFITFIADMRWRHGHINREYTFLLDPPEFVQKQSQPASQKKAVVTKTKKVESPTVKSKSRFASVSQKKSSRVQKAKPTVDHSAVIAAHVPDKTYQTKKADTLWNIATKVKPDSSVTTYQTMQALFVLNQDAFIDGNINLLKQGKTLSIPTRDEILQINGKKAVTAPSVARTKDTQQAHKQLTKQTTSSRDIERPSDTVELADKPVDDQASLSDEGQLKIIPPTDELLNKPVNNREDLKLINKALKTSIETIKLLKDENDDLSAQIEALNARISSLDSHNEQLNDKITEITTYINENEPGYSSNNASSTSVTVQTDTVGSGNTTIAVDSDVKPQTEKSRSFVRELLTNPVITLALAIFIVIVLIGILLTARKTNEKRKQRKENAYRPYSEIAQEKPARTKKPSSPKDGAVTQPMKAVEIPTMEAKADKDEDNMDFFEYFEKKINAPDDDTSTSNVSAPAEPDTSEENFVSESHQATSSEASYTLDISDKEIEEYEKSINESYKDSSPGDTTESILSEVDTYLAYGNYDKVEEIILNELQNKPTDKNLHLKLLESFSLSNKRYEFMKHVKSIINILNDDMVLRHRIETMYQQSWDEALNISKFT